MAERVGRLIEALRNAGLVQSRHTVMARAGQGAWALALEFAGSVEALWRSLGTDLHVAFWDRLLERYLVASSVETWSARRAARMAR